MKRSLGGSPNFDVVLDAFDFEAAVMKTAEQGFFFEALGITREACEAMELEAAGLCLTQNEEAVINEGTSREVTQSHERAYWPVHEDYVPIAAYIGRTLAYRVHTLRESYPELAAWQPTEAGYQQYRAGEGHISPHRDRQSDQLLAVTITVKGSSLVKAYETIDDPVDYSSDNLRLVDEIETQQGSVMLLKAPGLADGQQTIHEALPPGHGNRLVLNLRMRPDVMGTK